MPLDSSPSPILLQDLKIWQDDYDNLFKKSWNCSDTTKGRSPHDSTIPKAFSPNELQNDLENWDQKAISPTKPFNQLLEERLAEDTPVEVVDKPKRPFLRKGDGLARFRMSSGSRNSFLRRQFTASADGQRVRSKPSTPKCKKEENVSKRVQCDVTEENNDKAHPKSNSARVPRHDDIDLTPLEIPDFIKPRGTWHTVFNRETSDRVESLSANGPAAVPDPQVIKEAEVNPISDDLVPQNVDEYTLSQLLAQQTRMLNISNNIPDRISKVSSHQHNQSSEISEKELRLFEVLEKKTDRASFCSTNTSILNLLSSTPHRNVKQMTTFNEPNRRLQFFGSRVQEVTKNTDVIQNFLLNLQMLECNKLPSSDSESSARTNVKSSVASFSDDERWSTRSPSPVTATHTECGSECHSDDASRRVDVAVNTSFNITCDETMKETCEQCEQLRLDIRQLQSENKKLKTNARDSETKYQRLERESKKTNQNHQETVSRLKEELETEKKKYAKEKTIFETYVKEAQNRPTKQERAEITRLKQELADAKEMMKLKDSKNGATQARLRTQVRQLEKEIGELKVTVEKLQKENAKLSANQKLARRPSEVKMLHEINRNLTKLTEGALKKQLDKSGSGDSNEGKENKDGDSGRKLSKNRKSKNESLDNDIPKIAESNIEQQYEHVFGKFDSPRLNGTSTSDKIERTLEDGTIEIRYGNGNVKTISPDGHLVTVKYFNGDLKETNVETNTIRYHYAESDSWQVQYADGTEVIEYRDGQKSKRYVDGKIEISYPDGSIRVVNTDGTEEELYPDGSKTIKNGAGEQILLLPNGQKEIHTKEYKRREYPDGTMRTLYPDGTVETVYSNGRVRLKDANGLLLKDTHELVMN